MNKKQPYVNLIWATFLLCSCLLADGPVMGVAARYPKDQGIQNDPAVFTSTKFESTAWKEIWSGAELKTLDVVSEDPERNFQPLGDHALRVRVDQGGHRGANLRYYFQKDVGKEPEEVYFRYYLRLANDWDPEKGGKLPGIGGTYNRGGWGGRTSNGKNGWSARGKFTGIREGNTHTGFYCYHAGMPGKYGQAWLWDDEKLGQFDNNRWYCIEQYVRLNTPGKADGILRGWVDGRKAFEKTDIHFRDVETLKVQFIWINVYHGGKQAAKTDDHLYIDHIVVSRKYIGPMKE